MTDDFPAGRRKPRAPSTSTLIIVSILFIVLALWLWSGMRTLEERDSTRSTQVGRQLAALAQRADELAAEDRRIHDSLATLAAGTEGMTRRVDTLYGSRRAGLLATEAEHLVRLAAQRVALMQDPAGALALLNAADAALKEIRGADTHAARAALARDTTALRDAAALDVDATWLRLAALPDAVDSLAATRTPAAGASVTVGTPRADAPKAPAWQRFREALSSLFSLRRVDEPLSPLVVAGERAIAAENFRLLAGQAQLALLQRRADVYRHALAGADHWLDRIAAGDPARRAHVHQELASLQTLDVAQHLPDLTASLGATRALASALVPESGGTAP